jgi:drug/metabolite transporter (DMT)-like permease
MAAAAYFLIGGRLRQHTPLVHYMALVYGLAALALVATCLVAGIALAPFPPTTWLVLVLLGLVPQVLGHGSFNYALGRLSATFVTAAVLGEALVSTLLAWGVLGQVPPAGTAAGGTLILAGLALAGRAEHRARR